MTRVTFGVAASSFADNMSIQQNALDFAHEFPLAVKAVNESFYVDDCLTGADTVEEAIELQTQLPSLFSKGDFYSGNGILTIHLYSNQSLHSFETLE